MRAKVAAGIVARQRHGRIMWLITSQAPLAMFAHAHNGKPPKVDAEGKDKHQAKPEDGHRDADKRKHHEDVVKGAVLLYRRLDANGNANENSQDKACDGDHERRRESAQDDGHHGPVVGVRVTKVPLQNAEDVVHVLLEHGLVEAHLLSHGLDGVGRCLGTEHGNCGVTWNHAREDERERNDHEQDGDGLKRPSDDCLGHPATTPWVFSSECAAGWPHSVPRGRRPRPCPLDWLENVLASTPSWRR